MNPDKNINSMFNGINPKQFGEAFFGREDERQETCINCGETWYAMHYKNGLCHSCQSKGVPGNTERQSSKAFMVIKITLFVLATVLLLAVLFLSS